MHGLTNDRMAVNQSRVYQPAEGGERACNFRRVFTEGEMLAVTKNSIKCVGGQQSSCAVHVDLQAVGVCYFFGESYTLAKGILMRKGGFNL